MKPSAVLNGAAQRGKESIWTLNMLAPETGGEIIP
jgi:hypothetical protein